MSALLFEALCLALLFEALYLAPSSVPELVLAAAMGAAMEVVLAVA